MRGSGTSSYFAAYTSMPKSCYQGKTPTLCTSPYAPGRTFWTSELSQTFRSPCTKCPKSGKVCWTYLAQIGLSDGGGVQDQASRNHSLKRVQHLLYKHNPDIKGSISTPHGEHPPANRSP
ncbi:ERVW-1 [Vulpes lagopus]